MQVLVHKLHVRESGVRW